LVLNVFNSWGLRAVARVNRESSHLKMTESITNCKLLITISYILVVIED